jgi:hypothetical protein
MGGTPTKDVSIHTRQASCLAVGPGGRGRHLAHPQDRRVMIDGFQVVLERRAADLKGVRGVR